MSNSKPTPPPASYRWKKGQSGNPHGQRPLDASLKGIKALTALEVCLLITKCFRMTKRESEVAMLDPDISILEAIFIRIITESIAHADFRRVAFLVDRTIGRATLDEPIFDERGAWSDYYEMPDAEKIERAKQMIREFEESR